MSKNPYSSGRKAGSGRKRSLYKESKKKDKSIFTEKDEDIFN